jgi:hypothetical protein
MRQRKSTKNVTNQAQYRFSGERIMKKTMLIITAVLFVATSFTLAAAGSGSTGSEGRSGSGGGYGGGSVQPGPEFATPRGFGEEASQDDTEAHERMFDEKAPGAWSKDKEPGKDKPSDNH